MGDDPSAEDELKESQRWLRDLENTAEQLAGRRLEVTERIAAAEQALVTAHDDAEVQEQVTVLLQGLEASWNKQFQKSIAKVISRGLTIVFEKPMELRISPKVRAELTTVDFTLIKGEGADSIEIPIIGANGGTVIAIISVLVRLLLIMSSRPPLTRFLWLDEPFAKADPDYIPAFGGLLKELQRRLHFQIVITSHEEALLDVADMGYEAYDRNKRKKAYPNTNFRRVKTHDEAQA